MIITFVLICANNNDVHIEKMSHIPDDPFSFDIMKEENVMGTAELLFWIRAILPLLSLSVPLRFFRFGQYFSIHPFLFA